MDEGLQNEFIRLRFNQLPKDDIIGFLKYISDSEHLNMSNKSLACIQQLYKSDIRSMINFMQTNQDIVIKQHNTEECELYFNIIDNNVWDTLMKKISNKEEDINSLFQHVHNISTIYNIDKKNIIKDFLNYIIRNHTTIVTSEFLNFVENIMHSDNSNTRVHIYYSLSRLSSFLYNHHT